MADRNRRRRKRQWIIDIGSITGDGRSDGIASLVSHQNLSRHNYGTSFVEVPNVVDHRYPNMGCLLMITG